MHLSEKSNWPEQPLNRSVGEGITCYERPKPEDE